MTTQAHLQVLVLDIPRHSEQVALLVEPIHLVLERQLARSAQVLEGEICLGDARVQRRLFCSNLFVIQYSITAQHHSTASPHSCVAVAVIITIINSPWLQGCCVGVLDRISMYLPIEWIK